MPTVKLMRRRQIEGTERGELVARARELRRSGATTREISDRLGLPERGSVIREALYGDDGRARGESDLRAEAVRLRSSGLSYADVSVVTGVAKSTLHGWLKDLELSPAAQAVLLATRGGKLRGGAAGMHRQAVARDARLREETAEWTGDLSRRELRLIGALAYWCEGATSKPWRTSREVLFINSDPSLIRLFLAWLDEMEVDRSRLSYRVSIHESANANAAVEFWAQLAGVSPAAFRRSTLKRHNPSTVRKNTEASYHGCLIVRVARSADLYREVVGLVEAVVRSAALLSAPPEAVG